MVRLCLWIFVENLGLGSLLYIHPDPQLVVREAVYQLVVQEKVIHSKVIKFRSYVLRGFGVGGFLGFLERFSSDIFKILFSIVLIKCLQDWASLDGFIIFVESTF